MESNRPLKELGLNEWQVAGIRQAIASLDRGEDIPHKEVKDWINSWPHTRTS